MLKELIKQQYVRVVEKKTSSINTRYYRTIKDLPIQESKVMLKLEAKTFFAIIKIVK